MFRREGMSLVNCYPTAKSLIDAGTIPIPLDGRKPLVEWTKVEVTPAIVEEWNHKGLWSKSIGVICGERSNNLVIIDCDGSQVYEAYRAQFPDLLDTHIVKTSRGYHLYYRVDLLPDNTFAKDIPQFNGEHIEVRAQNLLVTIPPSLHSKTGKPYEVVNEAKAKSLTDLARVVAWVKALDPKPKREHPTDINHDDNLNPKVLDALRNHFQNLPKVDKAGDWLNCQCPDPKHKDDNPSFGYNIRYGVGHCFGCNGIFNTKTLCELVGVDYKALGGLFEKPSGVEKSVIDKAQMDTPPTDESKVSPKPQSDIPQSLIYISGRQARQQLTNTIDGVVTAKHPPLPVPLYFLRKHGIRIFTPGRLNYFASISGGGKTQMMELIVDRMLERGNHVIIRSDEWISRETHAQDMEMRRIQRNGGPTYQQIALHNLWEHEEQLHLKWQRKEPGGIYSPRDRREGVQFTPKQYDVYQRIKDKVNTWPGEAFYLLEQGQSVEKMIAGVEYAVLEEQAHGRKPVAFFLDYAQLVWLEHDNNGKNWIEQAITKVKDMCGRLGLVGFVFSQLKKESTDAVKDGKKFSPTMMNWLSETQANLVVMWLAEKNNEGRYITEDRTVTNPATGISAIYPMRQIWYEIVKSSFTDDENAKGWLDWNPVWLRIEDAQENRQVKQSELMGESA
jgi:hypothetical protein